MNEPTEVLLLLAVLIAAPLIPANIAKTKGRSFLGFYIYGLFFWVIALIHSLVMESSKPTNSNSDNSTFKNSSTSNSDNSTSKNNTTSLTKKTETRDLNDDSYKLHLAEKYSIKRNDLFEKFVCDDKMFDRLDIALAHAHRLETLQLESSAVPDLIIDSDAAIAFLRSIGYEVKLENRKYVIHEPAGGRTKGKNAEELTEYAVERGFGQST